MMKIPLKETKMELKELLLVTLVVILVEIQEDNSEVALVE